MNTLAAIALAYVCIAAARAFRETLVHLREADVQRAIDWFSWSDEALADGLVHAAKYAERNGVKCALSACGVRVCR